MAITGRERWLETLLSQQGRKLFCWIPVGVGSGAAIYFSLLNEPSWLWWLGVGGSFVGGLIGYLVGRPSFAYALSARTLGISVCSIAVGFAAAAYQTYHQPVIPSLPQYAVWVSGWVKNVEQVPARAVNKEARRRIVLENVHVEGTEENIFLSKRVVKVTLKAKEMVRPQAGDEVQLRVLLHALPMPSWPYGRDGQREGWFDGVAASGTALSSPHILISAGRHWGTRWREWLAQHILQRLPQQKGAIAATLLCGETGALSEQTRQEFAASGLAHLLAVAGLHLGFVMGICGVVLRGVLSFSERASLFWPCRGLSIVGALVLGMGYVWLTGCHIPGLRALGMASYAVLALLLGRRVVSWRALACLALMMELWAPSLVLDVSFQMSFAAVMALIAGYERGQPVLSLVRERSWGWARFGVPCLTLLLTSLFAGLATLPLSMAHFGVVQPWFVVANLIAVPITGVWIMPMGMLALLLIPIGGDEYAFHAMGWGIRSVQYIAHAVSSLPGAYTIVPSWAGGEVYLFFMGLCIVCLWRGWARWSGLLVISISVGTVYIVPQPVVLLAPDEKTVAVRDRGGWMMEPYQPDSYIGKSWQHDMGAHMHPFPAQCHEAACHVILAKHVILLNWQARRFYTDEEKRILCQGVSLVVSLGRSDPLCLSVPQLRSSQAYDEGAWAVYERSSGDLRLVSDQEARGARPWVPHMGYVDVPALPIAKAE